MAGQERLFVFESPFPIGERYLSFNRFIISASKAFFKINLVYCDFKV